MGGSRTGANRPPQVSHQAIIRFNRLRPSRRIIQRLADHLQHGRLAVVPSETQYALCALAASDEAVRAVRALKGRQVSQPFSAFFGNPEELGRWNIRLPESAAHLAEVFWPGPLTLVLPATGPLVRRLGSHQSIGVRISPEPIVLLLVETLGVPVIATSANPSGAVLSARAENRWLHRLAESGQIQWFRPSRYHRRTVSTVIDCTGARPRLLREGAIPRSKWESVVR